MHLVHGHVYIAHRLGNKHLITHACIGSPRANELDVCDWSQSVKRAKSYTHERHVFRHVKIALLAKLLACDLRTDSVVGKQHTSEIKGLFYDCYPVSKHKYLPSSKNNDDYITTNIFFCFTLVII